MQPQTQQLLAQLISTIAEAEKKSEMVRQVLAEQNLFEPYTTFRRLDQLRVGELNSADISEFLEDNKITANPQEINYICRRLDHNKDGKISYPEQSSQSFQLFISFLKTILPKEDERLRKLASLRDSYYIEKNMLLPYEVEWSLARVMEQELINYRKIQQVQSQLNQQKDFNSIEAFKCIDKKFLGYITMQSLSDFIKEQSCYLSKEDMISFFRAIDLDQDGRISYSELFQGIVSLDNSNISFKELAKSKEINRDLHQLNHQMDDEYQLRLSNFQLELQKSLAFQDELVRSRQEQINQMYKMEQNLRQSRERVEEAQSRSQDKQSKQLGSSRQSDSLNKSIQKMQQRVNQINASQNSRIKSQSPFKTPDKQIQVVSDKKMVQSRIYETPPKQFRANEEYQLVQALKEQILSYRELEDIKCQLSFKADFHPNAAFNLFDQAKRGYLSQLDLELALNDLKIHPTNQQISLLFDNYNASPFIKFQTFLNIILPVNQQYQELMLSRDESVKISDKTKQQFRQFWKKLFQHEDLCEMTRQRLASRPNFNASQAFYALDLQENGFLTQQEFQQLFKKYGIFATTKDIDSIVIKYDKNSDGKISYNEFVQELTPKRMLKL